MILGRVRRRAAAPHTATRPAVPPQSGQATVELALVLPVVAALLLLLVQAGLIARDQVLVTHAAREAARAASVDPGVDVGAVVSERTGLTDIVASTALSGDVIRVDVRAEIAIRVPVLALLRPTITLDSSASMRVESG